MDVTELPPSDGAGLSAVLGAQLPPSVQRLPASRQAELVTLVEEALRRQRSELAASLEVTLKHVPLPLRPVVRKVLL